MYYVYWNQAAVADFSLYFFIFLSSFQTFKIFVRDLSETVRPRNLFCLTNLQALKTCIYKIVSTYV